MGISDIGLITIRQNATSSGMSDKYLSDLFLKQNKKCSLSGVAIADDSVFLDKIDPKKGYEEGNVRWIHKNVGIMRAKLSDKEFLEWCRLCSNHQYVNKRPSFEEYFIMLAFDISARSEDKHIKHGAVIVDNLSKHIIGTGYNATFKGSDLSKINLDNREERRPYMIHAEENAIMNCARNPLELVKGASIFITGLPCVSCLQKIINFGITHIYYAKRTGSITEGETEGVRKNILSMSKIEITEMPLDNIWVKKNLQD